MTESLLALLFMVVLGASLWRFRYQVRGVLDRMAHAYLIRSSKGYRNMYIARQVLVQRQGYSRESPGVRYLDWSDVEKTLPTPWQSYGRHSDTSHPDEYHAEVVEDQTTLEP